MKTFVILGIASVLAHSARGEGDVTPAALPMDRYAAMIVKSPFALATATAASTGPQASFAANWFVSGLARLGDVDFVTIKARDVSAQFSLFGHEPNPANGVSLASVNWSDAIGKSTVVLQLGTETAKLEFNEADLRSPQPAAGGTPGTPGTPAGATPPSASAVRPNNTTALPPRPTHSGGLPLIIPRQPAPPTAARNPAEVQRRDKIISQPR